MSNDCKSGCSYAGFRGSLTWCLSVLGGESKTQLLAVLGAWSFSEATSSWWMRRNQKELVVRR